MTLAEFPRKLAARCSGLYALNIYLPLSAIDRARRARRRARRGVTSRHAQATRLPPIDWSEAFANRPIYLLKTHKRNGNTQLGELAVLALAAAATAPGSEIIEIGTFDGRTTLNLAVNAPDETAIFTLDLPPDESTQLPLDTGERHFVDHRARGEHIRSCPQLWSHKAGRIVQLLGDSATFDWSGHFGKAGLVFVDGSHSYPYAMKDSETAMRLVRQGGIVIWHDYGVWEGVTRALEELAAQRRLDLRHIHGTSLAFWRAVEMTLGGAQ